MLIRSIGFLFLVQKGSNAKKKVIAPRNLKDRTKFTSQNKEKKKQIYKELTKIHEEFVTGTCLEVLQYFDQHKDKIKGEFVVIIESV
jgi:16S rRNA C1402 (ribose-2'-O) methylase RsmI